MAKSTYSKSTYSRDKKATYTTTSTTKKRSDGLVTTESKVTRKPAKISTSTTPRSVSPKMIKKLK